MKSWHLMLLSRSFGVRVLFLAKSMLAPETISRVDQDLKRYDLRPDHCIIVNFHPYKLYVTSSSLPQARRKLQLVLRGALGSGVQDYSH